MMKSIVTLLAFSSTILIGSAPDKSPFPEFQFREWKVGDPYVVGDPRILLCVNIPKGKACAFSDDVIAGDHAIQIGAAFSAKGLFAIEARFDSERADQVEATLRKRYGRPCAFESRDATNGLGMKFPYRRITWCFSDGKAVFRSIGNKISEADFEFLSKDASVIGADGKVPEPDF